MRKERQKTVKYLNCDGCEYVLGLTETERAASVRVASKVTMLRIPWEPFDVEVDGGVFLEFHFHGPEDADRHDCFRYWAHNPSIMRRSLKSREMDDDEIDRFMAIHLYRDERYPHMGGVARPEVKV